jgi:hypothetical protein
MELCESITPIEAGEATTFACRNGLSDNTWLKAVVVTEEDVESIKEVESFACGTGVCMAAGTKAIGHAAG